MITKKCLKKKKKTNFMLVYVDKLIKDTPSCFCVENAMY